MDLQQVPALRPWQQIILDDTHLEFAYSSPSNGFSGAAMPWYDAYFRLHALAVQGPTSYIDSDAAVVDFRDPDKHSHTISSGTK